MALEIKALFENVVAVSDIADKIIQIIFKSLFMGHVLSQQSAFVTFCC